MQINLLKATIIFRIHFCKTIFLVLVVLENKILKPKTIPKKLALAMTDRQVQLIIAIKKILVLSQRLPISLCQNAMTTIEWANSM